MVPEDVAVVAVVVIVVFFFFYSLLFVGLLPSSQINTCMFICGGVCATVHMWKSEDNHQK